MKETADSRFEEEVKQSKTKVIVEEYEKLSSSLIFEIIRHDGEKELDRATVPLIFSALAAGLMISFSFISAPSSPCMPAIAPGPTPSAA